MSRILMICPWFGPLPPWMDSYRKNIIRLKPYGYDWMITTDLADFRQRVERTLDINSPVTEGSAGIHAFRPALAVLYADKLKGYDFWGHTDFDCLYGRVWRWLTDDVLDKLDIFANHYDYISGPWTIYRNTPLINNLFQLHPGWAELLEEGTNTGWAEDEFTKIVDDVHESGDIRRLYQYWQTCDLNSFDDLRWDGERLMEAADEVFMAHFRRLKPKIYPPQCLL